MIRRYVERCVKRWGLTFRAPRFGCAVVLVRLCADRYGEALILSLLTTCAGAVTEGKDSEGRPAFFVFGQYVLGAFRANRGSIGGRGRLRRRLPSGQSELVKVPIAEAVQRAFDTGERNAGADTAGLLRGGGRTYCTTDEGVMAEVDEMMTRYATSLQRDYPSWNAYVEGMGSPPEPDHAAWVSLSIDRDAR